MRQASRDRVGGARAAVAAAPDCHVRISASAMGVPIQVEADPKFAGIAESALSGWGGAPDPGTRHLSIRIASAPRLSGNEPVRIEVDGGRCI